jgi:hypothetical protein
MVDEVGEFGVELLRRIGDEVELGVVEVEAWAWRKR